MTVNSIVQELFRRHIPGEEFLVGMVTLSVAWVYFHLNLTHLQKSTS
jgi:hypothetical protein